MSRIFTQDDMPEIIEAKNAIWNMYLKDLISKSTWTQATNELNDRSLEAQG